jgi:hypothetical protein
MGSGKKVEKANKGKREVEDFSYGKQSKACCVYSGLIKQEFFRQGS